MRREEKRRERWPVPGLQSRSNVNVKIQGSGGHRETKVPVNRLGSYLPMLSKALDAMRPAVEGASRR